MQFPNPFQGGRPAAASAAERVAASERFLAAKDAALTESQTAYESALARSAATAIETETDELRRAHAKLVTRRADAERARDSLNVARRQHEAALQREAAAAVAAEWDAVEGVSAKRAALAAQVQQAAQHLGSLRRQWDETCDNLARALPPSTFGRSERDSVLRAANDFWVELQRTGVMDDHRLSAGIPVAPPITQSHEDVAALISRLRATCTGGAPAAEAA